MSSVLQIGYAELGVSWESGDRVQEYIDLSSRDPVFDQKKTHSRSWCTDFAYWVIDQAGLPTPEKSRPDPKTQSNSTSRFFSAYSTTSNPKPGDLYHMPYKGTKAVWHIGFVVDAESYDQVLTLDGNSDFGGYWTFGVGGGWVCMNWRNRAAIQSYLTISG